MFAKRSTGKTAALVHVCDSVVDAGYKCRIVTPNIRTTHDFISRLRFRETPASVSAGNTDHTITPRVVNHDETILLLDEFVFITGARLGVTGGCALAFSTPPKGETPPMVDPAIEAAKFLRGLGVLPAPVHL